MNKDRDPYSILGILPGAETVVVIAAYRALANLYHPDKWRGDPNVAHDRMSEINAAYAILGDSEKRWLHDAQRSGETGTFTPADDEAEKAFDTALDELEDRWNVAVSIFPDLVEIRSNLAKTAHRLAFAFVTYILESKNFDRRLELAIELKSAFLQRYFGSNPKVLAFAEELIDLGMKDAVMALNRFVDVLGINTDPSAFVRKIENDFDLPTTRASKVWDRDEMNLLKTERENSLRLKIWCEIPDTRITQ